MLTHPPLPRRGSSWWDWRRIATAALLAIVVATLAFAVRFNTLGGALGGFDNDHFIYLVRTDMLLDGEQPLRDFADSELRGAWPALTYEVSAWAQQIGGRTLLPEAYVTVGLIAAAHVLVFLLALDLSRRWGVALLAAAVAIATVPKLYNYPKVLMLALGVWALRAAVARPSVLRLGSVALVTVIAALFRHDLALYVAAGLFVALLARDGYQWRMVVRSAGIYSAIVAIGLLPSAIWVQVYQGIPSYWRALAASVTAERARTELTLPPFDWTSPLALSNLELVTYYAFWGVVVAGLAVLIGRLALSKSAPLTPEARATAAGLLVMSALVNISFLRANLAERFGDAAAVVVLLAAWTVGAASEWTPGMIRRGAIAAPVTLLLVMAGAAYLFSDGSRELDTSGLSDSWDKTSRRYQAVRQDLSRFPPEHWSDADAEGTLSAARYVSECTRPSDRVLVIGPLHEVPVFARRHFAAGQPMFKLSMYTSADDQRKALSRLEQQSVPVIVADDADFENGFATDYPLVARYVADRYRVAGTIEVDDEPRVRVLVETDRQPLRIDPHLGLPCFQ